MSLRVGLGASQEDLDVQGEIDFDFFEESDCSSSYNKSSLHKDASTGLKSADSKSTDYVNNILPLNDRNLKNHDLNRSNVPESSSSQYFNKPLITVSCDDATGLVQKTTIETVIPTPFNYKDNKCGKSSPVGVKKSKKMLSPRLKSKIFNDDAEISDDSSLSSMSESELDISTASDESVGLNDETDSMTDVSPLMSPYQCNSPMPRDLRLKREKSSDSAREAKKEGVKFPEDLEKRECPKCDAIDIHELMKAVKRLEIGQNINAVCHEKCSTPSVITQHVKCRKNLSFSNEETRRIDNDNQILLKKIVAQQNRLKPRNSAVRVLSTSAVNRQKQQRQIDLENLALLKRLESTKASRDVSRIHLLKDYERRSAGVISRASSRSSKSSSHGSTSRMSNSASGRSSAISVKSSILSNVRSLSAVSKS